MVLIWQFAQEPSSASSAFQFSLHWPNFTAGPSEGGRFWSCASSCSKLPAVKFTWVGEACPVSRKKSKHAFPHLLQHSVGHENLHHNASIQTARWVGKQAGKHALSWTQHWQVHMALTSPLPGEVELTVIRSTLAWPSMPCHNNLHTIVLSPPTGTELLNQWRCCVPKTQRKQEAKASIWENWFWPSSYLSTNTNIDLNFNLYRIIWTIICMHVNLGTQKKLLSKKMSISHKYKVILDIFKPFWLFFSTNSFKLLLNLSTVTSTLLPCHWNSTCVLRLALPFL